MMLAAWRRQRADSGLRRCCYCPAAPAVRCYRCLSYCTLLELLLLLELELNYYSHHYCWNCCFHQPAYCYYCCWAAAAAAELLELLELLLEELLELLLRLEPLLRRHLLRPLLRGRTSSSRQCSSKLPFRITCTPQSSRTESGSKCATGPLC